MKRTGAFITRMRIDLNIAMLRHILWTNQPFLRPVDYLDFVFLGKLSKEGVIRTRLLAK